jgi:hypothetical protein
MADDKGQIAFEELGLGSLLRRWRLIVPPNQREYAWTDREVTQLLQDFAKAINEVGIYFLGTIVTIPRDEGTLEVVDGQQRLATTAILLAAIRDYLRERNEDLIVQSIDDEFLSGIDRERRIRVPKLKLNIDDNEIFDRIVTRRSGESDLEPLRASHERLLLAREEARKHVRRIVAPLDEKEHGDLLNRWVSFLEHRALVVLLRVPDDANAYKMFETLNDRGLRTSQADLIKNFLFSRSDKRMNEVQSRWSYMRGALESASEDTDITINFLRHALIVQRGHLREADVYDRVQDIVKSEPAAVTFAATLETLANIYVATFNPENERWNTYQDSVRRAIEVFNLFDIKPLRPLILAIAARMEPRQAAASYNFLIALGVRLITAASTRSGSVEIPVAEAAKQVFLGAIDTVEKLREMLAALTPTDGEFRAAFRSMRVSNAKFARYYLRSLEMTAKNESEPWFVPQDDKQVINLEHVLPKKPEENWPQFDEETVRQWTTRLGNLALMRASENSDLRSQAFSDKKLVYTDSPYLLTSQIAEAGEWTPETIDERQRTLADLAVKTWRI